MSPWIASKRANFSARMSSSSSLFKDAHPVDRSKISSPLALISTTNMLSYNAPDLATVRNVSSSSTSSHSSESSTCTSTSSRPKESSFTDASSVDSSPISLKLNHPAIFNVDRSDLVRGPRRCVSTTNKLRSTSPVDQTPPIPLRTEGHSVRAHEKLARQRSLQNLASGSMASSNREVRSPFSTKKNADLKHPFEKELMALSEVLEETTDALKNADDDVALMREKNLLAFSAADYIMEIQPFYLGVLPDKQIMANEKPGWI